jgi:hypothetical protein
MRGTCPRRRRFAVRACDRGCYECRNFLVRRPARLAHALGARSECGRLAGTAPDEGDNRATAHWLIRNPFCPSGLAALFSMHPRIEGREGRLAGSCCRRGGRGGDWRRDSGSRLALGIGNAACGARHFPGLATPPPSLAGYENRDGRPDFGAIAMHLDRIKGAVRR